MKPTRPEVLPIQKDNLIEINRYRNLFSENSFKILNELCIYHTSENFQLAVKSFLSSLSTLYVILTASSFHPQKDPVVSKTLRNTIDANMLAISQDFLENSNYSNSTITALAAMTTFINTTIVQIRNTAILQIS